MKKKHKLVTITPAQISQWADNLQHAIGGFRPARPQHWKRHTFGPVVDHSERGPLIAATPVQVAVLAAILANKTKSSAAEHLPEAIDLLTTAAGLMARVNFNLAFHLGTADEPPGLTMGQAMTVTGLKERALRKHVARFHPKLSTADWDAPKTLPLLPAGLVTRIRDEYKRAKQRRSAVGYRTMKKSAEK